MVKITKKLLQEEAARLKAERESNKTQQAAEQEAKDMAWVTTCLEGALGNLLLIANRRGHAGLLLIGKQCRSRDGVTPISGLSSPIPFIVRPGYPPLQALLQLLQRAELDAALLTYTRWSLQYGSSPEGCDIEATPQDGAIYGLKITWDTASE